MWVQTHVDRHVPFVFVALWTLQSAAHISVSLYSHTKGSWEVTLARGLILVLISSRPLRLNTNQTPPPVCDAVVWSLNTLYWTSGNNHTDFFWGQSWLLRCAGQQPNCSESQSYVRLFHLLPMFVLSFRIRGEGGQVLTTIQETEVMHVMSR